MDTSDRVECGEEYTDEPARSFRETFKEHLKASSPIYDNHKLTGYPTTADNFNIVGRKHQNIMRTIKEAIYIRQNDPSLPQQEHWQKPTITYLGWISVQHSEPNLKENTIIIRVVTPLATMLA